MSITLYVDGVGVWAPGMETWEQAKDRFQQPCEASLVPATAPRPALLSSREQRRASPTVRLALEVALQAVNGAEQDPARLPSIFATANGDSDILNYICQTLARQPEAVSPTKFHNSVHNAAGGYWSIGTGCRQPLNCLSSGRYSVSAGLLEAAMQLGSGEPKVLLCAYDVPTPEPLSLVMPVEHFFACGLVLSAEQGAASIASLKIDTLAGQQDADELEDAQLQRLREDNPAAEILPLLLGLASVDSKKAANGNVEETGDKVRLALSSVLQLRVAISSCR
ncbi:beta-ketoacyl synthase chain length factor [Aestuariirhabdus sp. Z084]|uniref:beta-ketoacyl synthase chain length factor n=1 Tax=Aestuariirhabdus haliotis TaxID=2918751 RepID=UPI00201B42E1|nr:beta-ketoacyl synthase chain length factor [Aestuariirhabdus haliotis]MCL6415854.1 beta-ketoacyl synthase chain length factor [Aestuariirhabdus haliotis]MCL6419844.1 beta-ketoacyl synthase chain length factor [Aestuariirhabdus haliotis]